MENRSIIKFHIAFWIVVISVNLTETLTYIENKLFLPRLTNSTIILIYVICTFYFFYLYISQYFLKNKNYLKLIVSGITYITVSGFLVTYISYYPFVYTYPESVPVKFTHYEWVSSYVYGVMGVAVIFSLIGILSKISITWYRNKLKQMDTEKQNLTNELAMLRAQVNPHFLFNTLNNIKSLIKSLPSKADYSIEKLNGIMNYMLNESSLEKVPLANEINYIKNYLELEKIRYTKKDFINFKISGDYSRINIPPLIFMPFIENAFKHGNKLSPAPGIDIMLDVNGQNINFGIKNYLKENYESKNKNSGFGLPNIRRRLDLLFEKNYKLEIITAEKEYSVKLNLNIL